MTDRPAQIIDPICGMTVDVDVAEAAGLLIEFDGRTYGFCRDGCRRAFLEDPAHAAAEAAMAVSVVVAGGVERPVIDEGMRRWYESCSCCLSDAYPEVKAQLDAERAAAAVGPVGPGICEAAEAEPEPVHAH
ncbi:MAG: YHS domain-containing protein [Chloroflexi bacterium]|nr:YHS domain-containing protein [Chloroflexota bacterium]